MLTASPVAQPILCYPAGSRETTLSSLTDILHALSGFEPAANIIHPNETRKHARAAVLVRLDVLRRVYCDDYHTNSYAIDLLAERVSRGDELIWFWGSAAEIAALRAYLAGGTAPVPAFAVGTVSVLPAEGIAGPGTGELCRSGSMDRVLGVRGPGVERIVDFMSGADWGRSYDSLFLTARNRASAPGVRGGEAVHRLHVHHVRSSFWGFAPWYVMQGGCVELLDLRECYRDPDDVARALAASEGWWLAEQDDADFVTSLCNLNFGFAPPVMVLRPIEKSPIRMTSGAHLSPEIQPFNYAYLVADPSASVPFDAALDEASSRNPCSIVACIPMDRPDTLSPQAAIAERGFRLYGMLPPRAGALPRRPLGFWCRVRPDLDVAPPFYVHHPTSSRDEAKVLDRANTLCNR